MRNILLLACMFFAFRGVFAIGVPITNITSNAVEQDTAKKMLEGVIENRSGTKVIVQMKAGGELDAGITGLMHKHFEEKWLGKNITGWMDIGKMEVVKVENSRVEFKILEEHSTGTINGEPIRHFKKGKKVKFEWLVPN